MPKPSKDLCQCLRVLPRGGVCTKMEDRLPLAVRTVAIKIMRCLLFSMFHIKKKTCLANNQQPINDKVFAVYRWASERR